MGLGVWGSFEFVILGFVFFTAIHLETLPHSRIHGKKSSKRLTRGLASFIF
jgi:hypothetical protein